MQFGIDALRVSPNVNVKCVKFTQHTVLCIFKCQLVGGTHPSDVPTDQEPSVELLCQLAQHPKVVAIGETGLDYYYTADHAIAQQASFIAHIHASKQTNKPLIVHTRDARADTIRILRAEKAEKGVLHCFTEDWDCLLYTSPSPRD